MEKDVKKIYDSLNHGLRKVDPVEVNGRKIQRYFLRKARGLVMKSTFGEFYIWDIRRNYCPERRVILENFSVRDFENWI